MRHYVRTDRPTFPKKTVENRCYAGSNYICICEKLLLRCLAQVEEKFTNAILSENSYKVKIYFTYYLHVAQVVSSVIARRSDLELTCFHLCHFIKFLGNLFFLNTRKSLFRNPVTLSYFHSHVKCGEMGE